MSCKYCEKNSNLVTIKEHFVDSFLNNDFFLKMTMLTFHDGDALISSEFYSDNEEKYGCTVNTKINYCPFCGRKLKEV